MTGHDRVMTAVELLAKVEREEAALFDLAYSGVERAFAAVADGASLTTIVEAMAKVRVPGYRIYAQLGVRHAAKVVAQTG